jgi:hypothetical protein
MTGPSDKLALVAREVIAAIFGEPTGRIVVSVKTSNRPLVKIGYDLSDLPQETVPDPPVPATNPKWRWLDPTSERIVEEMARAYKICPTGWTKAEDIAALLGEPCSGTFRTILGLLVERNILESRQRYGYRLLCDQEVGAGGNGS